jgi:hypothetical protein
MAHEKMLYKIDKIDLPDDDPFRNDPLDRRQYCDVLSKLVCSITQPFVMSLEAPWGYGKTTFIEMWKKQLEINNYLCLYFNAWETDFSNDPLISFVGEINHLLQDKLLQKPDDRIKEPLKSFIDLSEKIINVGIPVITKAITIGSIDRDTISDLNKAFTDPTKLWIKSYQEERQNIHLFKTKLSELVEVLKKYNDYKTPIIIFIDELDRCKPDYSLLLLEKIKHIFNIEGIVFIVSVDRIQLENSIKSIYGSGMEIDGYLRKFIDLRYQLPEPKNQQYLEYLFSKYDVINFIKTNRQKDNNPGIINFFKEFINNTDISLRALEQIFITFNLVIRTYSIGTKLDWVILVFLLFLKTKNYHLYSKLTESKVDLKEFISEIRSIDGWRNIFGSHNNQEYFSDIGEYIVAQLIFNYTTNSREESIEGSVESILENGIFNRNVITKIKKLNETTIGSLFHFQHLISTMEMTNNYVL